MLDRQGRRRMIVVVISRANGYHSTKYILRIYDYDYATFCYKVMMVFFAVRNKLLQYIGEWVNHVEFSRKCTRLFSV
jgi:hypothetical protein